MIKNVLLVILLLMLSGCATIVNGTKQTISFMSEPSGAEVTVGGEFTSRTPAALPLSRGKDYTAIFKKEGYESQTVIIKSSFDHVMKATLGNIWNYILPGLIVDAASGGAYEFNQQLINVILVKEKLPVDKTTKADSITQSPVIRKESEIGKPVEN